MSDPTPRAGLGLAASVGAHVTCPDHQPQQHRDGRPPWCQLCGRTADGSAPVRSSEPPAPRPLPPVGTRVGWVDGPSHREGTVVALSTAPRHVVVQPAEDPDAAPVHLSPGFFHVKPALP